MAKRNEPKSVGLPDDMEKRVAVVTAKTGLSFNDLCLVGLMMSVPLAESDNGSTTIKHILVDL